MELLPKCRAGACRRAGKKGRSNGTSASDGPTANAAATSAGPAIDFGNSRAAAICRKSKIEIPKSKMLPSPSPLDAQLLVQVVGQFQEEARRGQQHAAGAGAGRHAGVGDVQFISGAR